MSKQMLTPTVAIIGGGPAGLSAAKRLAPVLDGEVLVIEREQNTGGIPRHADHLGYGIRDRKRFMSGPAYAKVLTEDALRAGAKLMTQAMATGWSDDRTLQVTTPAGRYDVRPDVFVFATGARERPRPARIIPGDRPAGIYTTGQLQNLVHLYHQKVGRRAVVIGAELVSWSAVMTLKQPGCDTTALVTEYPKGESYSAFRLGERALFQAKAITNSKVVRINGKRRVQSVEIEQKDGQRRILECDTVVFTGDWIPDNELLVKRGVDIDANHLGPKTDQTMQTSVPGIFSVGNVNHPVETADVVALEGEYVADQVLAYLSGQQKAEHPIAIKPVGSIRWISPGTYVPGGPNVARNRLIAWVDVFDATPAVSVRQRGVEVARKRVPWPAAPGRVFRIPADVLDTVDPLGGDIEIALA